MVARGPPMEGGLHAKDFEGNGAEMDAAEAEASLKPETDDDASAEPVLPAAPEGLSVRTRRQKTCGTDIQS